MLTHGSLYGVFALIFQAPTGSFGCVMFYVERLKVNLAGAD